MIGEASVRVTNKSQNFHWVGYGLKLHIPEKALPTHLEECKLLIKVGISGQFALPQNTSLVSAVYWLDSEPRCKFSKHLTVEIQHCALSSQMSRLNFAVARCSQSPLPYTFKILKGGEFNSQSTYGRASTLFCDHTGEEYNTGRRECKISWQPLLPEKGSRSKRYSLCDHQGPGNACHSTLYTSCIPNY